MLAARGDVAELDWSTHNHYGRNPQRIRTPPCLIKQYFTSLTVVELSTVFYIFDATFKSPGCITLSNLD